MIRSVAPEVLPFRISSLGRFSGQHMIQAFDTTVASSTAVWPSANRAFYMPVYLPSPFTVARFWVQNGSNATGNCDVGLYSEAGDKLVSTGSTARAGATQAQYIGVTDARFGPGTYYLALALDTTAGSVGRLAGTIPTMRLGGIFQQDTAFALPSSMTPAALSTAYAPHFGFSQSDTF